MSRYIDAEPIEKFIENGLNTGIFGHDAIEITTEIHFAQTVDAVKVVRCKDCEFWNPISGIRSNGECKCGSLDLSYGAVLFTKEDDYCSHALLKEG